MAKRTVCLSDGKCIGIESIFSVINGKQINIPEKLNELRKKSQSNELYCPCGCGANLILVAGDRNLREQHFRLKNAVLENECHVLTEGKNSVDSKIVLKCWLDDKLKTDDVETRVPINFIGDTKRKYEFSFLSRSKGVAVSYSNERVNLSDEKFDVLEANTNDIQLIYVVDIMNSGSNGQYPEALMKIQDRQGYCLLLCVEDASYTDAMMCAVFYSQDNDGFWREIRFADGSLSDFAIENGQLQYKNELISGMLADGMKAFEISMSKERARREEEKKHREEEKKRREEEQKQRQEEAEKERKRKLEEYKLLQEKENAEIERKKKEFYEEQGDGKAKREAEYIAEIKRQNEYFRKNIQDDLSPQPMLFRDANGDRWIKCEICGMIAKDYNFPSCTYNWGTCKICYYLD